jgi:ECF sigma factor
VRCRINQKSTRIDDRRGYEYAVDLLRRGPEVRHVRRSAAKSLSFCIIGSGVTRTHSWRLLSVDGRQGKIVEVKFFGGLSPPEISEALGISRATVGREWATARVWWHRQMSKTG